MYHLELLLSVYIYIYLSLVSGLSSCCPFVFPSCHVFQIVNMHCRYVNSALQYCQIQSSSYIVIHSLFATMHCSSVTLEMLLCLAMLPLPVCYITILSLPVCCHALWMPIIVVILSLWLLLKLRSPWHSTAVVTKRYNLEYYKDAMVFEMISWLYLTETAHILRNRPEIRRTSK